MNEYSLAKLELILNVSTYISISQGVNFSSKRDS